MKRYFPIYMVALCISFAMAQEPVSVDQILTLLRNGISEDVIKAKVESSGLTKEPDVFDIMALKGAGASDGLVQFLLRQPKASEPTEIQAPQQRPAAPQVQQSPGRRSFPRWEILAAGSFFNRQDYINLPGDKGFGGYSVGFAGNFNSWVGIFAEWDQQFGKLEFQDGTHFDMNFYQFQVGPQFSARRNRVTVFGRPFVGAIRSSFEAGSVDISHTDGLFGFGGGLDLTVSDLVAIRLAELDYLGILWDGDVTSAFKGSFGVVFRIR